MLSTRARSAVLVLSAPLVLCASAVAQSLPNDTYDNRAPVEMGATATSSYSNVFADVEPGEPLTENDPAGTRCGPNGNAGTTGAQMMKTVWWEFAGTGGSVTVSTEPSNPAFDSVLAVYDVAGRAFIACDDDIGAKGGDLAATASKVVVPTTAGHSYAVQVGVCASSTASPQSCAASYGQPAVSVTEVPGTRPTPPVPTPPVPTPPVPTPTPPAAAPAKPPKLTVSFSGYLFHRDRSHRFVRPRIFSVRAPAGTTLAIRCSPAGHCPFRGTLRRAIGPKTYSIAALLKRRGSGRIAFGTAMTFTLTKPGYRARQLVIRISRAGLPSAGKVKTLG
jgi:hypothetical protein